MTQSTNKFLLEKIKIKNFKFPRFMTAPMDGITDSPFRQLIRQFCTNILLFTEMRHVASIVNWKKTKSLKHEKIEHPLCFQISANNTNFIEEAVEKIIEKKFDLINLNAGCPAKKVVKSESGSALMANPNKLKKIILKLNKAINNRIPITLKIRAGFKEKNALDISLMAQDLGIDCLIIHPRTQPDGFITNLDFELVKKIKETIKIPLVFSGNIIDFDSTKKTYELTGVDGFMIGRALYGAPWKIKEIIQKASGKNFNLSTKEKIKLALKHLELSSKFYGKDVGFKHIKKHISQYVKKIKNAATIRKKLVTSESEQEMKNHLNNLLEKEI